MDRNKRLNCAAVNELSITGFLERLGYQPVQVRGNNYWYCSPFRGERTASFKVNIRTNRWFDFGCWIGGKLVDFGTQYYSCSVSDFLHKIIADDLQILPASPLPIDGTGTEKEHKITILSNHPITSRSLTDYLNERRIPIEIAHLYCRQVGYELDGRKYFAIGFKNNSGGYELRNSFSKLSSSPKDITTIRNGYHSIAVFEGFLDFLSYLAIYQNNTALERDHIILNTLSFFQKASLLMEGYDHTHLYLDNDIAGQNCSQQALRSSSRFIDEHGLYEGYKDLNDYWMAQ